MHVRTYPCSFIGANTAAKQPRREARVSTWLGEGRDPDGKILPVDQKKRKPWQNAKNSVFFARF